MEINVGKIKKEDFVEFCMEFDKCCGYESNEKEVVEYSSESENGIKYETMFLDDARYKIQVEVELNVGTSEVTLTEFSGDESIGEFFKFELNEFMKKYKRA